VTPLLSIKYMKKFKIFSVEASNSMSKLEVGSEIVNNENNQGK
jgi:hypothetical protein